MSTSEEAFVLKVLHRCVFAVADEDVVVADVCNCRRCRSRCCCRVGQGGRGRPADWRTIVADVEVDVVVVQGRVVVVVLLIGEHYPTTFPCRNEGAIIHSASRKTLIAP